MKKLILPLLVLASTGAFAQSYFSRWPKGTSPTEIGTRVTERFIVTPHTNFNRPGPPKFITYPETCTWLGALTFTRLAGNKALNTQLAERFEPLFGTEENLIPPVLNVDYAVFGSVPLELFQQTGDKRYLTLGQRIADEQWGKPSPEQVKKILPAILPWLDKGLSWHTRFWIDDMYMITALQTQAYRATKDQTYLDRAATEMVAYLDELQQANGLFYHAPDVPYFWGRGDGWMAAGMSELLRSMPKDHPSRPRILKGYHTMMASLLKYQDADGMWHQLIDDPNSWPETSSTGMFTFAFVTGVKEGWLDAKTYGPAARKAWLRLITYLNEQSDIREVCEGTNKKNDHQYYLDRKRVTGDLHGQAPLLWCATAFLRK